MGEPSPDFLVKEYGMVLERTSRHPNGFTMKHFKVAFLINMNCKFCGFELSQPHRVLKHMSECDADILVEYKTLCEKLNYLLSEPIDRCYLCGKSCLPEVLGNHWKQCHPRIQALFQQLVARLNICDDPDFIYCIICAESCNSLQECVTHICSNHTQYLPYLYHMSMEMIGCNPQRSKAISCKLCRNLLINRNPNDEMAELNLLVFDLLHQFYYQIIFACRRNEDFNNTEETCIWCGEVFLLTNYVKHLGNKHPFAVLMYGYFFKEHYAFINEGNTCAVCDKKLPLNEFTSHFEKKHLQLSIIKNQLSGSYIAEIESNIQSGQHEGKLIDFQVKRNVPATVDCVIRDVSNSEIDEFQIIKNNNNWQPIVKVKPLDLEAWAKDSISHTSGTCVKWQPVVQIEQMKLDKLIPEKKNKIFVKKHPTLKTISYFKKELLQKKKTLKYIKYSKNRAFNCLSKLSNISTRNLKKQLKSYRSDKDIRKDLIVKWICDVQYSCGSNISNMEENAPVIESQEQNLQAHTNDKENYSNKPDEGKVLESNEICDTDEELKDANKRDEENAPESNETLPEVPEIRIIIPGIMNKFEKEKAKESHDKIDNSQVKMNRRTIKPPRRLDDYVLDWNKTLHVKDQVVNAGKQMNEMEKKNKYKELAKKVLKCQKCLTKYVTKHEDILDTFKLNLIHARKIITSASIGNAFMKQMDLIDDKHVRKNIKTLLKDLIEALTESKKIKNV
ncbi:hypothetical protein JTE90_010406 [Oedothorax gibbosus]|uniref:C2H2-type domain-containing protein n=1 Tax=Oedothorax gibbosus TaxID=931172 RepID=A0AAV6W3K5_9ARAC|nr:hypothetical protein JTE90_010406 [Oedothorax gibbosus]